MLYTIAKLLTYILVVELALGIPKLLRFATLYNRLDK